MAVPPMMFDLLCRVAREQGGGRACAAGYPDLLVSETQLKTMLGEERSLRVPVREDSKKIAAWHGVGRVLDKIFESRIVFRELGYQLDVIDINPARGDEIILDLNVPLPPDLERSYDLVLDTGTCEHCFNIGNAALNLASLVNKGGYLIQAMPLNVFNHGFYNVNPTWFYDFYPTNGFRFLHLQAVANIVWDPKPIDLPAFDRFSEAPPNSIIIAVVRRETMVTPLKVPMQHKYAVNPGLAG